MLGWKVTLVLIAWALGCIGYSHLIAQFPGRVTWIDWLACAFWPVTLPVIGLVQLVLEVFG